MGLFFAIMFPAVAGFFIASWFLRGDTEACFFDRVFFGFGVGTGLLTLIIFIIGLLGIGFSLPAICTPLVVISVVFIIINLKKEGMRPADYISGGGGTLFTAHRGLKLALALMILIWILCKFYFVISESMLRPVFSWDTWFNWSAGAKFFFYEKGLLLDPGSEFYFGSGYRQFLGHPLHTPLLQVWFALCVGSFDEALVTMWSPLYFIALIGVFHLALKKETTALYGLICVFFLASAPLITYHAIDAYSDLPLAFYFLASTASFWRYLKLGDRRYLMLSGLFLGISVFTKNEGLFFFIATGAALSLYLLKEGKKPLAGDIFSFLVPFLIFAAPWLIFKTVSGIGFGHSGAGSGLEWLSDPKYAEGTGRGLHFEVFWIAIKEVLVRRSNFNLIFPFWIILSIWGFRRVLDSGLKYLYIIIFLVIGAFAFTYLTLEATAVTESTGIHRNLLTYTPVIFLSAALLLAELIRGRDR